MTCLADLRTVDVQPVACVPRDPRPHRHVSNVKRIRSPHLQLAIHVDDFCQECSASTPAEVREQMYKGGEAFIAEVRRANLTISGKNVLLCSNRKLARDLISAFRCLKVDITWAQETEHLGQGRGTHSSRTSAALARRFRKAKKRAKKLACWRDSHPRPPDL